MNADFPVNRGTTQSRKAVPVTAARGCDGGRLAQHFLISEALLHSFSLFYRVAASAASDIIAIFWRRQPKDAVRRFPSLPTSTSTPSSQSDCTLRTTVVRASVEWRVNVQATLTRSCIRFERFLRRPRPKMTWDPRLPHRFTKPRNTSSHSWSLAGFAFEAGDGREGEREVA